MMAAHVFTHWELDADYSRIWKAPLLPLSRWGYVLLKHLVTARSGLLGQVQEVLRSQCSDKHIE